VIESEARVAASRGLYLHFEVAEEDPPHVSTDATVLRRIVSSLIENSMKYTSDDGTIVITLGSFAERTSISVEDNGCGINSSDLPYIFERFYRGRPLDLPTTNDDVSSNPAGGTGLGLYVVKSMLDELGADIIVESPSKRTNTGTRFTILLPASPR
jgi:signal transduction histidine kinase